MLISKTDNYSSNVFRGFLFIIFFHPHIKAMHKSWFYIVFFVIILPAGKCHGMVKRICFSYPLSHHLWVIVVSCLSQIYFYRIAGCSTIPCLACSCRSTRFSFVHVKLHADFGTLSTIFQGRCNSNLAALPNLTYHVSCNLCSLSSIISWK